MKMLTAGCFKFSEFSELLGTGKVEQLHVDGNGNDEITKIVVQVGSREWLNRVREWASTLKGPIVVVRYNQERFFDCRKCGVALVIDVELTRFCPYCGTPVS